MEKQIPARITQWFSGQSVHAAMYVCVLVCDIENNQKHSSNLSNLLGIQ